MKLIPAFAFAVALAGCASPNRALDPWAPALPKTLKLAIRAFQLHTEYPAYPETEIEALLSDKTRFARNGNPLEEQVVIQSLRKHGISFESVPQSFLWIPYPLTEASGWPTRRRVLIVVRQTPENLKRINEILGKWESERQQSIGNEN